MELALVADRAATAQRSRVWLVLLTCASLAGVVGVLKGLSPKVRDGAEFYWLLTYAHGFIRRALIGTLVHPFFARSSFDQLAPSIAFAHALVCLAIVGICGGFFLIAVKREPSTDARVTLTLALLVLMCSEWPATLAHDVGYVDIYLVLLVLAGLALVLRGWYAAAAIVTAAGPLIHEAFVFLWAPAAIVLVWSSIATTRGVGGKLAAAFASGATTLAVVFLQSGAAAARAIDALPVSAGLKDGLQAYEIGQTLQSSFHEMVTRQFPGNAGRVEVAAAFFLLPSAAIVWAAAFCYWPRWRRRWTTLAVVVAATMSPLMILLLAWDLSRFLVWSNLAAAIALLAAGTPELVP